LNHNIGIGTLAGIGFTVAIFVTELAFVDREENIVAKISIFIASIASASLGLFAMRFLGTKHRRSLLLYWLNVRTP
jgi:NhaA family Na+:H+ antiporter